MKDENIWINIIIIILLLWMFFTPMFAHGFFLESPQVSRILLSIQANLSNAVVWKVSTCSLISKTSSLFTNPLEIVPSAPTTISITFMFHSFFSSVARSRCLSLFSLSFNFTLVCWDGKVHYSADSLFCCWLSLTLIVWPKSNDPFVSKSLRVLYISFSELCIYHLFAWSNSNFSHNSQLILPHPVVSSLIPFLR